MLPARLAVMLPAAVLLTASPLVAQQPNPGDRVRVSGPCQAGAPCALVDGGFVSWRGSTLTVSHGDRGEQQIEVLPSSTVEVFRGSKGHSLTGLLVGTLAGGAFGAATSCGSGSGINELAAPACASGVTGGLLGGMILGGVIGALIRSEKWDRVTLGTLSLGAPSAPGLGRPVTLSAQLRF